MCSFESYNLWHVSFTITVRSSFWKGENRVKSLFLQSQFWCTHSDVSTSVCLCSQILVVKNLCRENHPKWLILTTPPTQHPAARGWGKSLPLSYTCRGGGWWSRHSDASYSGWGRSRSWRNCLFYCPRLPSSPGARAWKSKLQVHDFPLSRNFSLITAEGGRVLKKLQILAASSFPGWWKVWFKSLSCHSSSRVRVCWDCNPSKNLLRSWNKNNINHNPDQKDLWRKTDINNIKVHRIFASQNIRSEWASFPP